jgi:hypothetical protein
MTAVLKTAEQYGLNVFISSVENRNNTAVPPIGILDMKTWISKCLQDANLSSLRNVMQVTGDKSPPMNLSQDEWDAIGIYMFVIFQKRR